MSQGICVGVYPNGYVGIAMSEEELRAKPTALEYRTEEILCFTLDPEVSAPFIEESGGVIRVWTHQFNVSIFENCFMALVWAERNAREEGWEFVGWREINSITSKFSGGWRDIKALRNILKDFWEKYQSARRGR